MKSAILHVCCAPCSTHCIEELRANDIEPILYFYNPNIHPKEEYNLRLSEVKEYSKKTGCELIIGDYETEKWFDAVNGLEEEPEREKRCKKCFEIRLKETSKLGKDFTTSLTVSRHKDSKTILPILKKLSEENNLEFVDFDFKKKDGYNKSLEISKKEGMHRQDYCGCIYSKK